jgi:hypothetical protein
MTVLLSGFITFQTRGIRFPVTHISCGILDFVSMYLVFYFLYTSMEWRPPWKGYSCWYDEQTVPRITWFLDFVHHLVYQTELLLFLSSSTVFPFVQSIHTATRHWPYSEPAHFTAYLLESILKYYFPVYCSVLKVYVIRLQTYTYLHNLRL